MKRSRIIGALICTAVLAAGTVAFSACGEHEHTFSEKWESDSSSHWHGCTHEGCAERGSEEGHTFGEWTTVIAATVTTGGQEKRTCSVCDYTQTRSTGKYEHKHTYSSEWSKDGDGHWHACTGGDGCEEISDYAEHEWDEGVIDPEPTEKETGVVTYTCTQSGCGASYTQTVPVLKHKHSYTGNWKPLDDELHFKKCDGEECEETVTEAHKWDTDDAKAAADCTECGYHREAVDYVFSKEWSYSDDGHYHKCIEEGYEHVTSEVIPHEKVWRRKDGQHWFTCKTCEYESAKTGHSYNEDKLCECDTVTQGLTYTIKDGEAVLTAIQTETSKPSNSNLTVFIIASHVKDVGGTAVPCKADDEGAVAVTSIGDNAFAFNSFSQQITEVYIPAGVTKLGVSAFNGCEKLTSLRTNAKFRSIGANAFKSTKVTSAKFDGIDLSAATYIGASAFDGTDITVADLSSVTTVAKSAFANCRKLESVTLGKVTRLLDYVFSGCTKLGSIDLKGITDISSYAFKGCTNLSSVTNVGNIDMIGNNTFEGCVKLESFDFTNVKRIIKTTFLNAGLKTLVIPATMMYAKDSFLGNPVETLTFGEGITELTEPLDGLTELKTVNFPSTLTSIAKDMFKGCTLTTINYEKTIDDFKALTKGANWDGGLEYTVVCKDGSITSAELNSVKFTEITQTGTISGTTVGASEIIHLGVDFDMEVVYYQYTAGSTGTLTFTAGGNNSDMVVLISKISFEDIKKNWINLSDYLGYIEEGSDPVTRCDLAVTEGDRIYIAVIFGEYSFTLAENA